MKKLSRPSVAMWDHGANQWYLLDCELKTHWFGESVKDAEFAAFNYHLEYTEYLEEVIEELKKELKRPQ